MPMVSKTVVFHVIHVGQDLNQGGHGAWGDVCAVGAHLGNACSFGNHLWGSPQTLDVLGPAGLRSRPGFLDTVAFFHAA